MNNNIMLTVGTKVRARTMLKDYEVHEIIGTLGFVDEEAWLCYHVVVECEEGYQEFWCSSHDIVEVLEDE